MQPSIKPEFYLRLNDTLSRCGPFDDDSSLALIFNDERLGLWRDHLPQAKNKANRIAATIDFLYKRQSDQHDNGLVLLLHVLMDRVSPRDICHRDLATLANELEVELATSSPNYVAQTLTSTPSIPDLLTCFEQKFRDQDLKKVYFLMEIGYNDLVGGVVSKDEKAMALIDYCQKRDLLAKLYAKMKKVYPGLVC